MGVSSRLYMYIDDFHPKYIKIKYVGSKGNMKSLDNGCFAKNSSYVKHIYQPLKPLSGAYPMFGLGYVSQNMSNKTNRNTRNSRQYVRATIEDGFALDLLHRNQDLNFIKSLLDMHLKMKSMTYMDHVNELTDIIVNRHRNYSKRKGGCLKKSLPTHVVHLLVDNMYRFRLMASILIEKNMKLLESLLTAKALPVRGNLVGLNEEEISKYDLVITKYRPRVRYADVYNKKKLSIKIEIARNEVDNCMNTDEMALSGIESINLGVVSDIRDHVDSAYVRLPDLCENN